MVMIRLTYRIETPGSVDALAEKIASDQSTGTFVEVPGETAELKARAAARVTRLRMLPAADTSSFPSPGSSPFNRAEADIDYPLDGIGTDLSALMTIAIAGAFAIKPLSGLRIVDMKLPQEFAAAHPGPQFGIQGSRHLMDVSDRPMIGAIIKPALGLQPSETAALVKELVAAGVDFIKDDEKMMSPAYSPLQARVAAVMPVIREHEQRTGKKVMYAFGISHADPDQLMRNHDLVHAAQGNAAVININSIGFGGMSFLRKRSHLVLHAHRNGWDLLTRHPGLGMDFKVYQQFWRLLGVDQFQINGIGAKYWEPDQSFVSSFKALQAPLFSPKDRALPVVCSGQWGGQAPETYERTGHDLDLLYLCGGGIMAHPMGVASGVRAVQQAWEAAAQGIALTDYAKSHKELAASLEKFGKVTAKA
jgi:ribulose-bisphosphate carboxylase large chain